MISPDKCLALSEQLAACASVVGDPAFQADALRMAAHWREMGRLAEQQDRAALAAALQRIISGDISLQGR